jgi:formylmethanofuran dehydrogenase subunit E
MNNSTNDAPDMDSRLPDDLKGCVLFHGHLCPGLVYGYLVAKEAMRLLDLDRSRDEEVVAISENDTCAVDALQLLLGTTMGKGNLILKDYGKNVFTVLNRSDKRAFRFCRKTGYKYEGEHPEEFSELEAAYVAGRETTAQRIRQKLLKSLDLLAKPFDAVFETTAVDMPEPDYAPLAPSEACAKCGEMTMSTKMVDAKDGGRLCMPCAEAAGNSLQS